jgi:hypothetical protein
MDSFKILLVVLVLFVIYKLYKYLTTPTQLPAQKTNNEQIRLEQPTKHEDFTLTMRTPTRKSGKGNMNLWDVDLLAKSEYSLERELVVDPNDEAFYRSHFKDFQENGFDDYGLNANTSAVVTAVDISEPGFATFDKNDLGYLGTDSQNVHSSLIQDTIKSKYTQMKKSEPSKQESTNELYCKDEIIEYAKYHRKNHVKIKDILEQIEKRNSFVTKLNDTEISVLQTSWDAAKDNVKVQILNELEDLTDNKSYIVCPSGVTSRIINANVVDNPESGPQREADLHEEMLNTASNIRTQLENNPAFQGLSEDQQTETFKATLIKKFEDDYKGVVPKEQIQKELDSWIDYV